MQFFSEHRGVKRKTGFHPPQLTFFCCPDFRGPAYIFFLWSWLQRPCKLSAISHEFVLNDLNSLKCQKKMRMINILLLIQFSFADSILNKNAVIDETILHRVGLGKIKGLSSEIVSVEVKKSISILMSRFKFCRLHMNYCCWQSLDD